MSIDKLGEATPIIIKGKDCGSDRSQLACFEISGQEFRVERKYESNPDEWIASNTSFQTGGIDSVTVGDGGPLYQYCKTTGFVRPLTVLFICRDSLGNEEVLFTVTEGVADKEGDCIMTIATEDPNTYFSITQTGGPEKPDTWEASEGSFASPITKVNVRDSSSGGDQQCCSLLTLGEQVSVYCLPPSV